jgi:hypothetical protein
MADSASVPGWAIALAAPAALGAAITLALVPSGRWWFPTVFLCRYADMLIWVARYWVVFRLVGAPVSIAAATAIAAVCQITLNIPIVGNGMGLREWAVGLTASHLPRGLFGASGQMQMSSGLAADLVNRVAELAVALPMGLLCAAYLACRNRK